MPSFVKLNNLGLSLINLFLLSLDIYDAPIYKADKKNTRSRKQEHGGDSPRVHICMRCG